MIRTFTLIILSLVLVLPCYSQVNYLDNYLSAALTLTTIGDSANSNVIHPRDLDFKPNSNELWVCNLGAQTGGSIVIFYNAGQPNQSSEYRKDSHSSHFMVYPSAMAFGDNGEWSAVSEIQNTNPNATTFMGPALWLSDTSIFARVFQSNWAPGFPLGSHIDMLHQSPFAMGIAHDSLKVYYVMDGHNGNICRYDFVQDHGPGYDDHSAGMIWRYIDVPVTRVPGIPSHMILDRTSRWLYYIDGGSKQVRRMNTSTGINTGTLTPPSTANEMLAGYYKIEQANVEVIDSFATQPCGIDYSNDRLIVSDFTSGDIYLYNTSGATVTFMDTIVTGQPGIMGVKIGPDGKIWCVNVIQNAVYRLDIANPSLDLAISNVVQPIVENYTPAFYSTSFNVCDGSVAPIITITNSGATGITSANLEYTIDGGSAITYVYNGLLMPNFSTMVNLPTTNVANGSHQLSVKIISVNGTSDDIAGNNTLDGSFRVIDPPVAVPYTETFTTATFPPAGSNYIHFNPNNFMSWETPGGFGQSVGSMRMDNYSGYMDITGQKDYLVLPAIDMTSLISNAYLRFNVAYAKYNALLNDTLQVQVSNDCGYTWATIYNKSGNGLSTAPNTTNPFSPTATQWRTDSVDIVSYAGQSEVIFMFTSTSNFGNNLFIDDIFIGDVTSGISDPDPDNSFAVYPNPVSDIMILKLPSGVQNSDGEIFSVDGKRVLTFEVPAQSDETRLDISDLAPGFYTVRISNSNSIYVQPVVKQ